MIRSEMPTCMSCIKVYEKQPKIIGDEHEPFVAYTFNLGCVILYTSPSVHWLKVECFFMYIGSCYNNSIFLLTLKLVLVTEFEMKIQLKPIKGKQAIHLIWI